MNDIINSPRHVYLVDGVEIAVRHRNELEAAARRAGVRLVVVTRESVTGARSGARYLGMRMVPVFDEARLVRAGAA